MNATLTQETAAAWIERWDAQQQAYLPDREERFTALIDAVQECAGRPDPRGRGGEPKNWKGGRGSIRRAPQRNS